ncbi:MAG: bleomycin resistance protein, partial [Actinomycetota bacterium]|nr:bleomycin resistance protein [Actinomycetota bacterium]
MSAERISPVVPVEDMDTAVTAWSLVLGVEPTFVDGDRWAQYDVGGSRLALAGTDRASDEAGVMIKVDDIDASHQAYSEGGLMVGPISEGAHEVRFELAGFGLPVTI